MSAEAPPVAPRATYRLQFSPDFGFRDGASLAPYLAALGISHVYASPFFAARPGSTHGYDVVDHNRLNPELGPDADFETMCAAFRAAGLGLIADFVPNHMGIGGAANRFWLDVLEWGPASRYAHWFDIDWKSGVPGLSGRVLAPFLGAAYGAALEDGALALRFDRDPAGFAVWAHGTHKLPVRPADYGAILRRAPRLEGLAVAWEAAREAGPDAPCWPELRAALADAPGEDLETALAAHAGRPGDVASWSALDALIARQHWRAAKFTLDAEAINYRRFFTISDLAGLRVEAPEVFDAVHGLLLDLLERGAIDGVRIDHIDGLRDPKAYAQRLRAATSRPFHLLVEKILARDERLPADWGVDGSTGYEVANLLVGLFTDPGAEAALTACHHDFTGAREPPEAVVRTAKIEIMAGRMAAEVDGLALRLRALAQSDARARDIGLRAMRAGLVAVIAAFDVYRTYIDDGGLRPEDRERIAGALGRARAAATELDPDVFDFLEAVLTLRWPDAAAAGEIAIRMQQVTGPVMAKGLEDTALYRYTRLIALNEVGSEPGRFAVGLTDFHAANAERLAREPRAMLATSTHDTKRGEDARMRIAAISWAPDLWRRAVFEWRDLLARGGAPEIDPNEAYFFFQLLLGAWPADWPAEGAIPEPGRRDLRDRVQAAMLKSAREAGRNTAWVFGDAAYEARLAAFVDRALDPAGGAAFLASFREAAATIGAIGSANALAQTALKLTIPGAPDIYQGAEFWDQSLVDPDNRRPVDFAARAAALAALPLGAAFADAPRFTERDKLALTARLLAFRGAQPELFAEGSYEPLAIAGPQGRRICAFLRERGGATLLVAVALGWGRVAGDPLVQTAPPELAAMADWSDLIAPRGSRPGGPFRPFARLPLCLRVCGALGLISDAD